MASTFVSCIRVSFVLGQELGTQAPFDVTRSLCVWFFLDRCAFSNSQELTELTERVRLFAAERGISLGAAAWPPAFNTRPGLQSVKASTFFFFCC